MSKPGDRLRREIRSKGPLPFARFMEEALYGEGGYYARESPSIGPQGDFVTGSSLSPLFGLATARLLQALDAVLDASADLLEAGYGTGAHLRGVCDALADASSRRLLGWDRIARELPPVVERIDELESVQRVHGLVFSYELFDALPVNRLVRRGGELLELQVDLDSAGEFRWVEAPLSSPDLAELVRAELVEGQVVDLASGWRPLYRRLAGALGRGLLVTCDYGFETERLYDPRVRKHGTLACYRQQRVHRNPFVEVGEQDVTAHVDLSVLREEGESAGLRTVALTRQAPWLAACGILDGMADAGGAERLEALRLMELDGMGDEIRVLVQTRDVEPPALAQALPGFAML